MAGEGLRVIADVGGTNARFAIARDGRYDRLIHVEVARYTSLHDALLDYLNDLPPALWPSEAAIAVAGPVLGDRVTMTNLAWSFSASELKRGLGLAALKVFNDFAATAMAVPYLPPKDVFPVGPSNPEAKGPIGVIGPGTGLGVSSLVPHDGRWVMVAGEGGHVTLPASTREEDAVIAVLRRRWDHVSAERVLSGSGLVNLYQAVCAVAGKPALSLTPADVTAHAIAGTDADCVRAFALFCALLGTVAGDLALTIGARGGVYIAGGILLRFKEMFAASAFRARFEAKGRFADYLRAIPTCLILEESPALLGLAKAPLD
ncbi:MAG: glucokinase [Bradyrhizobiaceae bacterium]|nr:MAG: glucokinase [Bradyrhizobiaceae bacterium]